MRGFFFLLFLFFPERSPAYPGGWRAELDGSSSVIQDDLDKTGHVRLFGVVHGEKGMLLQRRNEEMFFFFFFVAYNKSSKVKGKAKSKANYSPLTLCKLVFHLVSFLS